MRKAIGITLLTAATVLSACGGGGGSPGETNEGFHIKLRADKASLPVNIMDIQPGPGHGYSGVGVNSPYTTTLYVNAVKGDRETAIPGGDSVFECNLRAGMGSGALFYLDGRTDHQDENKNPLAYRSITLPASSGGGSFHLHSGNQTGAAIIDCTVTDERGDRHTASQTIQIGTQSHGMPASVELLAQAPGWLGTKQNLNGIPSNVVVQAFVRDDGYQPVADPVAANVRVRIVEGVEGGAGDGARLLSDRAPSGQQVTAQTLGGVATFSLRAGPNPGVILLELVTDRADSNVVNGILDPITQYLAVRAVHKIPAGPLVAHDLDLGTVGRGESIARVLEAEGGALPYKWEAINTLPDGLELMPSGVIVGTVDAAPGEHLFAVRVIDVNGQYDDAWVRMTVEEVPITLEDVTIELEEGGPGFYQALHAEGGVKPYTWSVLQGPVSIDPVTGVLSGGVGAPGVHTAVIQVSDAYGNSETATVTITVSKKEEPQAPPAP